MTIRLATPINIFMKFRSFMSTELSSSQAAVLLFHVDALPELRPHGAGNSSRYKGRKIFPKNCTDFESLRARVASISILVLKTGGGGSLGSASLVEVSVTHS